MRQGSVVTITRRQIRNCAMPGHRFWKGLLLSAGYGVAFSSPVVAQGMTCLPIQRVEVRDADSLPAAAVDRAVAPFANRCLGLADFNAALKAVTDLYIEAGLITSRVYLPEQDLRDGVLELAAIEGRIEAVEFNGKQDRLWERFTFPGIRGHVGDLREIEQGLDNIRSMPSFQGAEMTLDAGAETGTSVLQVAAEPDPKPWRLSVSTDNYGFEGEGEFNPTLSLGWDNLIGINDSWEFSYTSAVDQTPFFDQGEPGQSSQQAAIGVTVPYGKWAYTLRQSWSAYETELPGQVEPIPADGDSFTTMLRASRLLHRDETSKTHLAFDLSREEKQNNIQGVRIETSSRVLTAIGAELSHQRSYRGGQLSGTLRLEKGIKALGAEDADLQPEGFPDAQYLLLLMRGDYTRSWTLPERRGRVRWISTGKLQYSNDRLYGGQQFRLGDNATIRGSKIALVEGSSGIFWRNEIEYHLPGRKKPNELSKWLGQPALYAGLDAGRVFAQSGLDIRGGSVIGGVIGLRTYGGRTSLDIGYAEVLSVSDGLQEPEGHFRMALNVSF
ncbi:ShlB/FhaC/HecB family hemolysin secretion/activation protein [Paracoccus onubensis]|uniref:ShlB/FhaC/HecB family hemolysin secretion/activation protein n=1 Tax=Paracoccus onubensis TaxID=1675788 RepID=UPI002730924E|nr:ShlB/FhaC/HecB family hemolysin secretion/activation protein [Paracoccus onubensis]MDP0929567.1 ShlB/FhaC/HecB family hemolysin secretion/activation protein [Paracoccus onubensis]